MDLRECKYISTKKKYMYYLICNFDGSDVPVRFYNLDSDEFRSELLKRFTGSNIKPANISSHGLSDDACGFTRGSSIKIDFNCELSFTNFDSGHKENHTLKNIIESLISELS